MPLRCLLTLFALLFLLSCQPRVLPVLEAQETSLGKEIGYNSDSHSYCYEETPERDGVQSMTCLFEAVSCSSLNGCKKSDAVCGFGRVLRDGICTCMIDSPHKKLFDSYICQNNYWVCDKAEGCGLGKGGCAYGKTCFEPVVDCFGVTLNEDLAKYRCEDKLWTCRHTGGCGCGGALVPLGSHCKEGKAYCGDHAKPENGDYKCVGACMPDYLNSFYQWVCQDINGCPCAKSNCGFGGSCHDGKCACGDDNAPKALEQYRCYSDLRAGVIRDDHEYLSYWICNREGGCDCGDKPCAMGESCTSDQKCERHDLFRPTYYDDFKYENGAWQCQKTQGCRCDAALCGNGQFCDRGQCSCDGDQDCTQSICRDGTCQEAIDCGGSVAPKTPGYLCENKTWICRNEDGCVCGNALYGRGIECREGKALCGNSDNKAPHHAETYTCDNAQWICNSLGGCVCGSSFAPSGSSCRNGAVYCGDKPIKDGSSYRCENVDGQAQMVCGYAFQTANGRCNCGDNTCFPGSACSDGQCTCGGRIVSPSIRAEGYVCESDAFLCDSPTCKCGDTFCGTRSICDADNKCRCNGHLAPSMSPEKYSCNNNYGLWACEDEDGCPYPSGICPKDHLLDDNKCVEAGQLDDDEHCIDRQCQQFDAELGDLCQSDKRPLLGDYRCELQSIFGLGGPERSGWTCTKADGCPCGDDKNADICRSTCLRNDDNGQCLEYTWQAQYLPICHGPRGIGDADHCVDACSTCNGLEKPSSPGYICDKRAWSCGDEACVCGLALCPKGKYCIDNTLCLP